MKISRVYAKLDLETKLSLLKLINVEPVKADSEPDVLEQLNVETEDRGVRWMLEALDKEQIVELYKATPGAEPEEQPPAEGKQKKPAQLTSKSAMLKRLEDRIAELKVTEWLDGLTEAQVAFVGESFEVEDLPKARKELSGRVVELIYVKGALAILANATKEALAKICKQAGMNAPEGLNKAQLLDGIETGEFAKPADKKEKKEKPEASKEKPEKIEKGITQADLLQHFYLGELQAYCKEQGVKSGGNKKELIKRILAFHEGDESVKAKPAPAGGAASKKRAAAADKKKEEPAKKKSKKEDGSAKEEKKEEKKDEKKEKEEEKEAAEPAKKKAKAAASPKKEKKGKAAEDKKEKEKEKKEEAKKEEKEEKEEKKAEDKKEEKKEEAKKEEKKDDKKEAKEAAEKKAEEKKAKEEAKKEAAEKKAEEKKAKEEAKKEAAEKKAEEKKEKEEEAKKEKKGSSKEKKAEEKKR